MKTEYGVGFNKKMEVEEKFSKFIFPKIRVEKHPPLTSHYGVSRCHLGIFPKYIPW